MTQDEKKKKIIVKEIKAIIPESIKGSSGRVFKKATKRERDDI